MIYKSRSRDSNPQPVDQTAIVDLYCTIASSQRPIRLDIYIGRTTTIIIILIVLDHNDP